MSTQWAIIGVLILVLFTFYGSLVIYGSSSTSIQETFVGEATYKIIPSNNPNRNTGGGGTATEYGGGTCESHGMQTIMSLDECAKAGIAIGYPGWRFDQPSGGYTSTSKGRTRGCVHNISFGGAPHVQYFPKAKGECGSYNYNCVCKDKDPTPPTTAKCGCKKWTQTINCSGDADIDTGQVNNFRKTVCPYGNCCDKTIPTNASGYCECLDGTQPNPVKQHIVNCGHQPFTCNDICSTHCSEPPPPPSTAKCVGYKGGPHRNYKLIDTKSKCNWKPLKDAYGSPLPGTKPVSGGLLGASSWLYPDGSPYWHGNDPLFPYPESIYPRSKPAPFPPTLGGTYGHFGTTLSDWQAKCDDTSGCAYIEITHTAGTMGPSTAMMFAEGKCPKEGRSPFPGKQKGCRSESCYEPITTPCKDWWKGCSDIYQALAPPLNCTVSKETCSPPYHKNKTTGDCEKSADCQYTDLSEWGPCSKDCDGGNKTRHRQIKSHATGDGKKCDNSTLTDTTKCNIQPCHSPPGPPSPTTCTYTDWSTWGSCTKPCGEGTKRRTRNIKTPATNGGTCNDPLSQSQSCNTQACERPPPPPPSPPPPPPPPPRSPPCNLCVHTYSSSFSP